MKETKPQLARRLGLFDATMIVMGGIIGSGIFMNPSVVARQVSTPFLNMAVWIVGGLVALAAAFIWAELAWLRPDVGGQYAYLREAFHPSIAFMYGWALLLVIQTGGMAAVAITFARYFTELTQIQTAEWLVAAVALGALTIINCLGVRSGSRLQSTLMVLKILAILSLIISGLFLGRHHESVERHGLLGQPPGFDLLTAIGAAMVPVLFAYGGWQTSTFLAGEIREPRRNLPRGLIIGVAGVVILYVAVTFVCMRVLGTTGLALTSAPASEVMRSVLGEWGARVIATGIAISTLGFLSQGMLTAPRVYFAMAQDGLFFPSVGRLHPKTLVPVVAIVLQGALAIVIASVGVYDQILNYVVSIDFIFFGLTAASIFVFHKQRKKERAAEKGMTVPGHPLTTLLFITVCWLVVLNTIYKYPQNTLIGIAILLAGIPAYLVWRWRNRT
ncbi:MAG TPA: amino acid permease [Pyrinomonadaceae bacterium]|nr:amino acid permease [Pyrinomonadaceae bacterium]